MDWYLFVVIVLFGTALLDLVVGVSNDAVNFLNSAVGSRVAPRHVIMIVASLGLLAGVLFSGGMMEVARKGIFHPRYFTMPELMAIFLAVMLTDVVLLDLFNTFGLPTSTTVSIVFSLLGAAVAVSLIKIINGDQTLMDLASYINTGKVLAIITSILLSVGISFTSAAVIQFFVRMVFTFDYARRLRRYGGLFAGSALAVITYFALLKGVGHAAILPDHVLAWIQTHTGTIMLLSLVFFALMFQAVIWFTRINILGPIVLIGTFALAMAFAANDLVNFIGVPVASFQAFLIARDSAAPLTMTMEVLEQPMPTQVGFLLVAGAVMVATLWLSRKARTVTKTEVSLGRQDEGFERFESSQLARIVLRMSTGMFEALLKIVPDSVQKWMQGRFEAGAGRSVVGTDGKVPEFDLLRASVNLIVSSALIAWGTSMKLPLSTTYVTFMVAMGTSLSDKAWGLESAAYRISGVLTVIGGWFFTGLVAFTVSSIFAFAIGYLHGIAIIGSISVAVYLIVRNWKLHRRMEKASEELELLDLKRVTDAEFAVRTCFEHTGRFLGVVREYLDNCLEGILTRDRKRLKRLRRETNKVQKWSNTIVANIFKTLRLLQQEQIQQAENYSYVVYSLQEISESLRDVIMRCHVHTSNQHAGLMPAQKKELQQVRKCIDGLLGDTAAALLNRTPFEFREVAGHFVNLKVLVEECDQRQVERIRNGLSKTRLSILFYGINNACMKIGEQTLQLLTIFNETLHLGEKTDQDSSSGE
ncbi:MAG: inorganic phosphate transporter [Desulfobacterales bacterium]|nr:inorganic phosphate transporter [Desulfobacterales bacterium]